MRRKTGSTAAMNFMEVQDGKIAHQVSCRYTSEGGGQVTLEVAGSAFAVVHARGGELVLDVCTEGHRLPRARFSLRDLLFGGK